MQEANGEGHLGPNQGKVQQAGVSPEHRPRLYERRDDQTGRWQTGVKPYPFWFSFLFSHLCASRPNSRTGEKEDNCLGRPTPRPLHNAKMKP